MEEKRAEADIMDVKEEFEKILEEIREYKIVLSKEEKTKLREALEKIQTRTNPSEAMLTLPSEVLAEWLQELSNCNLRDPEDIREELGEHNYKILKAAGVLEAPKLEDISYPTFENITDFNQFLIDQIDEELAFWDSMGPDIAYPTLQRVWGEEELWRKPIDDHSEFKIVEIPDLGKAYLVFWDRGIEDAIFEIGETLGLRGEEE